MFWIVVHEPFWAEIHSLRNITSYLLISLRCQHVVGKVGPGSLRLGLRQPGSLSRTAEVKNQRTTKSRVDMTHGVTRRNEAVPVPAQGKGAAKIREESYKKLVDLTDNHTEVSEDLKTFFLIHAGGLTDEQHKRILGQANDEYVWHDVVNAVRCRAQCLPRGSSASKGTPTFNVEQDTCEETVTEDEDCHDPHESEAVLHAANMEEMQPAMGIVDRNDLQNDAFEVMAAEMQKLGEKTSHWAQTRRAVARGNTNRGFVQDTFACGLGREDPFQQPTVAGQTPGRERQDQVLQLWRGWTLGGAMLHADKATGRGTGTGKKGGRPPQRKRIMES